MVVKSKLTHLHVHTHEGSLLDSILRVEDAVKWAKENNHSAMALTEHGTMHSFVNFWKECKKNDIKPIMGCEVYEVEDLDFAMKVKHSTESPKPKIKRNHLVLLVKNEIGLKNLFKIVSVSHTDFKYTKPLIDLKYIKDNNLGEGIIALTACLAGRLPRYLEEGKEDEAKIYFNQLEETFDCAYAEIQSHNCEDQINANKRIVDFSNKYNKKYVITTDAHMLEKKDVVPHSIFIAVNQNRDTGEFYDDCYLQTETDVINTMSPSMGIKEIEIGMKNTKEIEDMINFVDIGMDNPLQMPKIGHPSEFNSLDEYYIHLVNKGFDRVHNNLITDDERQIRMDRLFKEEKPVLDYLGYIDYFVMLYMLRQEFEKRNIPINYGRGSGGNSLSLYYLGVTQVDSVKWDLDFSRFANKGRKSVAD